MQGFFWCCDLITSVSGFCIQHVPVLCFTHVPRVLLAPRRNRFKPSVVQGLPANFSVAWSGTKAFEVAVIVLRALGAWP